LEEPRKKYENSKKYEPCKKYEHKLPPCEDLSSTRRPIMVLAAFDPDIELGTPTPIDRNGCLLDMESMAILDEDSEMANELGFQIAEI
jgi:hypothetical protein